MAKKKQTKQVVEEQPVVEEVIEEVVEETIDTKQQVLLDFKDFWEANCKGKSVAKMEIGMQIWNFWKSYTGRTDRFNGCSACVMPKINYLKNEAKKYNIEIK